MKIQIQSIQLLTGDGRERYLPVRTYPTPHKEVQFPAKLKNRKKIS